MEHGCSIRAFRDVFGGVRGAVGEGGGRVVALAVV